MPFDTDQPLTLRAIPTTTNLTNPAFVGGPFGGFREGPTGSSLVPLDPVTVPSPSGGVPGGGLLGTHTTYNCGQTLVNYVLTKDLTDINRTTKQANRKALDYFLGDLTRTIKRTLVGDLIADDYRKAGYDGSFTGYDGLENVPFDVQERFNQEITTVRNRSLLTYAENRFTDYVKNLKKYNRYVHVIRERQSSYVPLETRYSNGYRERVKRRMNGLAYQYRKAGCVYVVLTLDPKLYGNDKVRMWREHKDDFHDFIDKVRRTFNRRGLPMPKFLHTVEGMKQPRSCGNPHINVVFFGCRRLMDWRKVLTYWGKGSIRINRTWDGQTVRNPVMYVCKYITKTYSNTTADNVLTQSLVWLFNVKSFSSSRDLILPLHPKGTGDWTADYFAVCTPQETFLDDVALIEERVNGGFAGVFPPPITKSTFAVRG